MDSRRSVQLRRADDSTAIVDVRINALPQSALRLAMATDITQQRLYEAEREQILARERGARDEAERANRLKDQFIAILGHELRNPLACIVTGVELLKAGTEDGEAPEWILDNVSREAAHLTSLINDLLETTRVSHGKLTLNKEAIAISTVVNRAVDSCRAVIDGCGHELTVALNPPDLRVEADPLRLEQVIVNLLTNASKFTPAGGQIRLETTSREGALELTVSDSGIGLSRQDIRKIFEAFEQIGAPGQGLGIGLTLVRQLVELHGGTVDVESEGPGKGSTFRITIPLLSRDASVTTEHASPEAARAPMRVLIVDDNESAAQMLQMLLLNAGYSAEVATTGLSALELAKRFTPELVLMDIRLPDISGHEAAKRLRDAGLNEAIIIALSGFANDSAAAQNPQSVFDAHLLKPASVNQIREAAESVAARKADVAPSSGNTPR